MTEMLMTCLILGGFAGLLAGLLGIGGGLVIVPILAGIFSAQHFPAGILMQLAVGTSLATIVVTSLSSLRAHHQRGGVLWPLVWQLSLGIVFGAWLGAAIAHAIPSQSLARLFGVFELLVAAQMLLGKPPAVHHQVSGRSKNLAAGGIIGTISAILGIGGGTLTVPYLSWHNIPMRQAVGTAAACGLPIALAGTVGFIVTGWQTSHLPDYSSGYVYWPAVAAISVTSMLAAPLGVRLAHTLPQKTLKKIFALFLVALGVLMLSRVG
jgi:uncharacterized membrane protein YfcA